MASNVTTDGQSTTTTTNKTTATSTRTVGGSRLRKRLGDDDDDDGGAVGGGGSIAHSSRVASTRSEPQFSAFMPNASPLGRKRRILGAHRQEFLTTSGCLLIRRSMQAWTLDAMVLWRDETTHAFIEIEFSDQSQNRNAHFSDYNGVMMAAIGADGSSPFAIVLF